jgi:hypothetical protein
MEATSRPRYIMKVTLSLSIFTIFQNALIVLLYIHKFPVIIYSLVKESKVSTNTKARHWTKPTASYIQPSSL